MKKILIVGLVFLSVGAQGRVGTAKPGTSVIPVNPNPTNYVNCTSPGYHCSNNGLCLRSPEGVYYCATRKGSEESKLEKD